MRNFTENLMTYALGRRVEDFDMPTVRAITRDAERNRLQDLGVRAGRREQRRRSDSKRAEPAAADAGAQ